jgi:NADPH2:quinone reductase
LRGIRVIATVRETKHKEEIKALGAEVIDLSDEELVLSVMGITGGKGVQGVLDPVGGPTATEYFKCMAVNGKVIDYAALSAAPFQVNNSQFVYRGVSLSGFGVGGYLDS